MAPSTKRSEGAARRCRERGYTYIGVLIALVLAGVALAAAGELWSTQAKREREAQLLFVGEQFRRAIESYYESTPGGAKQFPRTLQDLVEDRRLPTPKRHLRRMFRDPMTGSAEWAVVRLGPNNTIVGVHSVSKETPVKQSGFGTGQEAFANAQQYADWKFVFLPGMAGTSTAPGNSALRSP